MDVRTDQPRRLVISGGASGIGAALTGLAVASGYEVVVLDLREPDNAHPAVETWVVDLTNRGARRAMLAELMAASHVYEGVVLCAGIQVVDREPFEQGVWDRTLELNLIAGAEIAATLAPALRRGAAVVWIGSTAAEDGSGISFAYAASKAALCGLMASFVRRHGPSSGLRGAVVHPGATDTPLARRMLQEAAAQLDSTPSVSPDLLNPQEVACVALHLIETPAVSGVSVRVDGGHRLGGTVRFHTDV